MRFKQIIENSTTAGSVATVAQPMMTQTRESVDIKGLKPVQQVMKGTKKKGPYANSITESKVTEDDLAEQDLIVIPGQGRLKRTGFVKHDLDQGEHEGHTLKNSLHTIARAASDLDKRLSVQSEFPEWVSEKIGAAKGMMVTVMDYLISSQEMQQEPDAMAEGNRPFRGVGGAFDRGDDERHDLDPTDWYIVKDGEMFSASIYPRQVQQAIAQGFSRTRAEAKSRANSQGVAEGSENILPRGTSVTVLHKGKKVPGKIVRYDAGKGGYSNAYVVDIGEYESILVPASKIQQQGVAEGKIDFAKKLQKNVDKSNKAVVKTRQDIGSRIADIGAGGKEYNVKTDAAWDAAKKKVAEGSAPKEKQKTPYRDINSPEYKAAADKQKEKMAKDKEAEPGKKLADKIDNKKK